jgi:glycerol-3-phosphate dehydrogenase
MNLLLDRPSREIALAAPGASGRMLTAVPWAGATLVGTYQSSTIADGSDGRPSAIAVDQFLADVNTAFPALRATKADIRLVHHGLTPAAVRGGHVDLMPEPSVIDHSRDGVAGLVSLVGVKYTTARWAAERAVNVVCRQIRRASGRCRTALMPLPHGAIADVHGRLFETQRELELSLDDRVADHLASWYGTEAPDVLRYCANAGLIDQLDGSTPVLAGEIAYAARHAAAIHLADAVLRRTSLGAAMCPSQDALERAAAVLGELAGWTADQRAAQIRNVEARYEVP